MPAMGRALGWMMPIAIMVVGCSGVGTPDRGDGQHPISAAEVEANAQVHLPPGTVLLSTTYQGFQDWHLTAVFRILGSALPGFLRDGGFGQPTPGLRAVTNADRPDSDTWKPDTATTIAGVDQTNNPVGKVYRKLLLDLSRAGEVTAYLVAFTT